MKQAGWILAVIAIGLLIYVKMCDKPEPKVRYTEYDYKQLEKRYKDTSKSYQERQLSDSIRMDSAAAASKANLQKLQESQHKLSVSQATVNRLLAKIEGARLEPEDNTWVRVSPHYKDGCDSLTDHMQYLQNRIDQYEEDGLKQTELMMYEITIRDSALNAQKDFTRKFSNQLDECMTQLKAKVGQKQRNQVYAGIGLFGNKINPLAGGQVNISLRTKNNQIYEITGATVGNVWYGGVGTKILIRFK